MQIKALIFDFDGLLVDTETPQLRVWQELYRSHGAELPLEEWVQCLGTSADAFDTLADLRRKTSLPIDGVALKAEFKRRSAEAIRKEPLRPGIEQLLIDSRNLNLKLAVASSSSRAWVHTGLAQVDAGRFFTVVCTADDVARVKPDPELYRLALSRLEIEASEAIVFEDSPNGIRAARAAGLRCVAYPNPVSMHLDLSQADLIVGSLPDYPLAAILQYFQDDHRGPAAIE